MSSVYNSEPPTNGKVVLHTTHGDIEIELWSKEAPKATKSFLQLAIDGFYDGCSFHRVIKGLFAQTGAPPSDNTDEGPDLYNGSVNFLSEQHSRLRFGHRGQVAMAGRKGSQFFMTLGKADWLNGQHCIIGKVTGDSIYNLVRLGEVDTDGHDVPTDDPPPCITRVEVLHAGPWEGMQPREGSRKHVEAKRAAAAASLSAAPARSRALVGSKASKAVLSFAGDEEEEEGGGRAPMRVVGSGRAVFAGAVSGAPLMAPPATSAPPLPAAPRAPLPSQAQDMEKQGEAEGTRAHLALAPVAAPAPVVQHAPSQSEAEELMAQIKASRKAVAMSSSSGGGGSSSGAADSSTQEPQQGSVLQSMRAKYLSKKRAGGDREGSTLARLASFQSTLKSTLSSAGPLPAQGEGAQAYHGQVMEEEEGGMVESAESASLAWAATSGLHFKKHIDDAYRYGSGAGAGAGKGQEEEEDGLVTLDPLLQGRAAQPRHVPAPMPAPSAAPAPPIESTDAASLAAGILGKVLAEGEDRQRGYERDRRRHSRSRSRERHRERDRRGDERHCRHDRDRDRDRDREGRR